jgi:hypothetical protein
MVQNLVPDKPAKPIAIGATDPSASAIPHRVRSSAALLVVPTALLVLSVMMVNAQGPWGANNRSDPEYNYLLNSLDLLTFHIPFHIDHPGTTLQEFGAVVVFCKWIAASLAGGWTPIQRAVLSQPDEYLRPINLGIILVLCSVVFLAGLRLYVATSSLWAALVLQFTLFLFRQTLLALPRISPEPCLIAIGFALMIPLIPSLLGQERNPARAATEAGALFGFGMLTKVTFLPLAAIAFLVGGRKERKRFAMGALVLGLLVALPILPRVPAILHWLTSLLIHTERYGSGPVGVPPGWEWKARLKHLIYDEPFIFCSLLYYSLVLLATIRAKRDELTLSIRRLLWVICGAIGLQLVMTLKHYGARYMLPSLVICALPNAYIVLWLSSSALPIMLRRSLAVLGAVLMAGGLWSSQSAVDGWLRESADNQAAVRTLAAVRRDAKGCLTIGFYKASNPGYALAFGTEYTAGVHGKALEELYPNFIFYDQFTNTFRTWTLESRIKQVRQMLARGQCVLLQGSPNVIGLHLEPEFSIEPIAQAGDQAIYRLHAGQSSRPVE